MDGSQLSILSLEGTPCEIGRQHGLARADEIERTLARLHDLRAAGSVEFAEVDLAASQYDAYFGPDEVEELQGIAEGANVSLGELVALNLLLYLDAGSGGLHFALSAEMNQPYGLLHGANEDLCCSEAFSGALSRTIFVRRPIGVIPSITFGVAGQIGALNGINAAGISVSSAALLDLENRPERKPARLLTVFVKHILERVADIDDAIPIYIADPGCTPYSICLTDFHTDRICQFEYDLNLLKNLPWTPDVMGTTHRLMRTNPGEPPEFSGRRFDRLLSLLGGKVPRPTAASKALLILRDRYDAEHRGTVDAGTWTTVCRFDNQISVLFHPGEGSLWVTSPLPGGNHPGIFYHFRIEELLPEFASGTQYKRPARVAASTTQSDERPLIDVISEHVPGERLVAESNLDPNAEVFLVQHRFKDRPLTPLVIMVETLAQGASILAAPTQRVVGLRNIEIQNGLRFANDDPQAIRVHAVARGSEIECQLTSDVRNRKGDVLMRDKPHLRGIVDVAPASTATSRLAPLVTAKPPVDPAKWDRCFYTENIVIYHGPVFRCLRALTVDGRHGWGRIVALPMPEIAGTRSADGWLLNPSLLDACLYACGSFFWIMNRGIIAVPDGFDELRLGRFPRPNEKCLIAMLDRGRQEDRTFYDFTLTGENGDTLVNVTGYRNKIVGEEPTPA